MNGNLYELIALGARYLFAVIMIIIVIRAWKITIVDSRRANSLRKLSPETGVCGEFLVLTGSGRVREGMRFPVIREGLIGSSRKADIRLRCNDVHRSHAFFELTKSGLRLRSRGSSHMYNSRGESRKDLILGDGGKVTLGQVELMLILTEGTSAEGEPEHNDDIFGIPDDSEVFTRRKPDVSAPYGNHDADADYRRSEQTAPRRNEQAIPHRSEQNPPHRNEQAAPHREKMFRDDIEIKSKPPRKTASSPEPIDLFLERTPSTVRPESSTPWDDDEDSAPVKVWDDWDDAPAKPKIKRKQYDDPFDV